MAEAEEFIQSVHPLLYNASLHDYRSAERRVKAWREVAASIGLSGQCVNAAILYPHVSCVPKIIFINSCIVNIRICILKNEGGFHSDAIEGEHFSDQNHLFLV